MRKGSPKSSLTYRHRPRIKDHHAQPRIGWAEANDYVRRRLEGLVNKAAGFAESAGEEVGVLLVVTHPQKPGGKSKAPPPQEVTIFAPADFAARKAIFTKGAQAASTDASYAAWKATQEAAPPPIYNTHLAGDAVLSALPAVSAHFEKKRRTNTHDPHTLQGGSTGTRGIERELSQDE